MPHVLNMQNMAGEGCRFAKVGSHFLPFPHGRRIMDIGMICNSTGVMLMEIMDPKIAGGCQGL